MGPEGFAFDIAAERGAARVGRLDTPHGAIDTPSFVAVGTQATVKSVAPEAVAATGTQVLFSNTYHLYLRPGHEVVAKHGGVHRFMNWDRPVMTDSGGFQVFSLGASIEHGVGKVANIFPGEEGGVLVGGSNARRLPEGRSMVRVDEEGVRFTSHIDGSRHLFTPERSLEIQRALGADIVLAFDECTSPLHDEAYTARSAERTHRWAERCLRWFHEHPARHGYEQALYGIVQGGAFRGPRIASARAIAAMEVDGRGFDGIAIGGNLGKTHAEMRDVLEWTVAELPRDRPRHLLGIGDVPGVFDAVARGCDTFDCVAPTRNARNGGVLARFDDDEPLRNFRLNMKNARWAEDLRPIDETCDCHTCAHYTRSYLRHLLKANEQLAQQLCTIHNLRFMARLSEEIRDALRADAFDELRRDWLEPLGRA